MAELRITTDPSALDVGLIHRFLSEESTWAKGISRELVERSLAGSLCFAGFLGQGQVAFARVISDYRRTQFGGWPFRANDPVHPRERGRFAKHADGRVEDAPA